MGSWKNFVFLSTLIISTREEQLPQTFESTSTGENRASRSESFENDYNTFNNTEEKCNNLLIRETDITTSDIFAKFDFNPKWIASRSIWDDTFESRYKKQLEDPFRTPLKVIIVPHSHNDPAWKNTYLDYFESSSKSILNSVISKLTEHKDMTFIWSEISFLQLWWDQANENERNALKKLIESGRFEITTGGWVMTDEANVHIYAMIDQLIEGHQWIRSNLNTTPTIGWSIDVFGHGATIPYLLAASDFDGTIILRIHYAWKKWFAKHQYGDFIWQPLWETSKDIKCNILTHNLPFDLYNTDSTCGPDQKVCSNYDFLDSSNVSMVHNEAKILIEQYSKTASLYTHNVALIPIGSDFTFGSEDEIEQQYSNYKKLIDYINNHKKYFNAEVSFGTPKDYFREIKSRTTKFPILKGDFFVYSDIYRTGTPAYWSGYYTTRPFYKILSNELEHNLRSSEILFTLAYNIASQHKNNISINTLKNSYNKIILARRNLGLFQHHDAITGTSQSHVVKDYGLRLFNSIEDTVILQGSTIEMLLQNNSFDKNFILSEFERNDFHNLAKKRVISFKDSNDKLFVIFNPLAQKRTEIITLRTTTTNISIVNENGLPVKQQINPVWNIINYVGTNDINISREEYEIIFLAELPPISLVTYRLRPTDNYKNNLATVYHNYYSNNKNTVFEIKLPKRLSLKNNKMKLFFNKKNGFLKSVTKNNIGVPMECRIMFAAYNSETHKSGAYLFKTNPKQKDAEVNILKYKTEIVITSGSLSSDITVTYGPFLTHTVRIYNTNTHLDNAIYIENDVDFGDSHINFQRELFMRLVTEIENGEIPEFYSDQNGFQFQSRVLVPSVGIEGNYYPITTAAFIQDATKRITLLTTHAQGAASLRSGELEVMLDRKMQFDDGRGMGEGITDSTLTRHKFWIIIEERNLNVNSNYQVPSLLANSLGNSLRYPPNVYFIDTGKVTTNLKTKLKFIKHDLPCDLHLLNVRTLTDRQASKLPSRSALLILHRQGYDCNIGEVFRFCNNTMISISDLFFNGLQIQSIESTSITALNNLGPIKNFQRLTIEPMDVKTFRLTFELEA